MTTKVLIVDDEPDIDRLMRQRLRRRLRSGQIELLSARNGVEALNVLAENADVGVAFCDINMPNMDGLTLLDRLRSGHPSVRAVMISAYGDPLNRRSALGRGAIEFLTKPLDFRQLERVLDRLLAV
ncbi:MAG: response regulator [Myxococcales bacterium]|nr:response regulator [Myxococcales bacterium]